ncbi:MAG: hypothetical protein IKG39_12840 [Lachnospiraceae bacterium]|nr:hypothetical protein [Lachnospiraceae bacterium]
MTLYECFSSFSGMTRYSNQGDQRILNNIDTYLQGLQGYGSIEYLDEYPRQSQGDKTRTIEILKDFYKYYEEKTGNRVVSSLKTVTPIDNPLERRLKIAEYLHEMHSREEIQDHFCIKESTLRKDLQALLGGIEVFGSKIQIVECENRKKKKNHYYLCNVFPVFLPLNLSEVYLMTAELINATKGNYFADSYKEIAQRVFGQLSDYGKKKVNEAAGQRALTGTENDFRDEAGNLNYSHGSFDPKTTVLYALKGGNLCNLTYLEGEKLIGLEDALIKPGVDDRLLVSSGDINVLIKRDQIVYCSIKEYH